MKRAGQETLISIVTPAFNEGENLAALYEEFKKELAHAELDWEWVVVDDHSTDETQRVLELLTANDPRVRAFRLSRNSGSHNAIACGLDESRGNCAILIAGDLQDPPKIVSRLVSEWRQGAQVVWAVREAREGESASTLQFSKLYYWVMRHICKIENMPATGSDCFLIDRMVVDAVKKFSESNVSILALLTWVGFRQKFIPYAKSARRSGVSGWTLSKKMKLLIDSIASFTYLPLRAMSLVGLCIATLGFCYAVLVFWNAFLGNPIQGWSSLMIVILLVSGIQMAMMGILGEYIWRALDESRRRPRYLIEWTSNPSQSNLARNVAC